MNSSQNCLKFWRNNEQIGLVFGLFAIILLHVPIVMYSSVFFTPITSQKVEFYTIFGSWFTALGAIFTVFNTVAVIYLMWWLHKKETSISLLSHIIELRKDLVQIHSVLSSEVTKFNDELFENNEALYINSQQSGFDFYDHEHLHIQEIKNLKEIIERIDYLYKKFLLFKDNISNFTNIDFKTYQEKFKIISSINEIIVLNKPSSEYKKSFVIGNKLDEDPEDMIESAKNNSLNYINKIIVLLEAKDHDF